MASPTLIGLSIRTISLKSFVVESVWTVREAFNTKPLSHVNSKIINTFEGGQN